MTKVEKKITGFITDHVILIGFIAVSITAFIMRKAFWEHWTTDYSAFLLPWINKLIEYPGLSGIGQNIGEYNVPYMLFLNIIGRTPFNNLHEVKIFSIFFDYLLAVFAALTVYRCEKNRGRETEKAFAVYAAALISPVAFIDSAMWCQCDSIWSGCLIVCLYCLIRERYKLCWLWFGIAFAFKLQAVFLLPLLMIYYFSTRKMSILNAVISAGVYVVMVSPAIFAGRSVKDTFGIYLAQTDIYHSLTMNFPSLYCLLPGDYFEFKKAGIMLTITVLGIAACVFIKRRYSSAYAYITLAFWSTMVCTYFLPGMHDRYSYFSCMAAIIWAATGGRKTDAFVAGIVHLVTLFSWQPYLFGLEVKFSILSVLNLAVIFYVGMRMFSIKEAPEELPAEESAKEETAGEEEKPAEKKAEKKSSEKKTAKATT